MRADARRNYERLVDAGRAAFTEHGADATMEDIARRAGVGPGTLYRHFPTRADLVEAVLRSEVEQIVDLEESLGALPPEKALLTWLRGVLAHSRTYQGLAASELTSMLNDGSGTATGRSWKAQCHERITAAGNALLRRGGAAGLIRSDVELTDLLRMVYGIVLATEGLPDADERSERMLAMVMNALRP